MPVAAFIVNRSRVVRLARFRSECERAAAASGWEPMLVETTVEDPGAGLAAGAVGAGAGLIFAAGGDGTVRACAEALAGSGVPLAIIPLGTANLAARALGVPSRLPAALAAGFGGRDRRIDLAAADGITFAAMAGIGLDAAVVAATPARLKERLGWLAYAAAGAGKLAGRRGLLTVRLDDREPLPVPARSVVVGNAGLLPGGFRLLPAARLDDGVLDVGILAAADPLGWLRVARRVVTGSGYDDGQLRRYQANRVEIRADAELPRQVDGEVIAPGRALTVAVRPRALTVRVPAAGPGATTTRGA
ncbi:MAG TPA: diacylglycerol kinase family protein [Streptosporangiaceae bacterium]|nr:diacylglycerol kinase family protein [Streptosporangiaceae bacterium]